jgi:penicillin-binding protein 1A
VYIKKIVDRNGKVLEQHDAPILVDEAVQPEPLLYKKAGLDRSDAGERSTTHAKRKIDEATAYILTTMLQGVVKEGTATNLKKIVGRTDIAGKTGTTNENVDAWFMGYSPDFTCGVWVGFDDEFSIGEGETGGKAAAPIWGYFMREALKDIPVRPFPAPATVEVKRIDPRTGLVTVSQNGVEEVFKVGSAPAGAETKIMKGPRWDYTGSDLDQF